MNLNHKYISIASVFIIVVLVVFQIQAQITYEDQISALKDTQAQALQTSRDTIAQLQATVATINKQLNQATGRQGDNQNAGTPLASIGARGNIFDSAQAGNPAAQAAAEKVRTMMGSMRQMISKNQVNAIYGDFIRGLHLSASEKESLGQIFAASMDKKSELAAKLAAGTLSKQEYDASLKAIDKNLRNDLSGYLYKDEMTAFDQYEATKDVRAIAQQQQNTEMALQRNVPDLNPNARQYVARVLTEELVKAGGANPIDPTTAMQNPQAIANVLDARGKQMDNALQRIRTEGALDKNSMAGVEDYINQQKSMQDAVSQMATTFLKK
jgi:hypothetical protein